MKPTMTYKLAHACGTDEANRRMRAAGRTTWNRAEYAAAREVMDRLWFRHFEAQTAPTVGTENNENH